MDQLDFKIRHKPCEITVFAYYEGEIIDNDTIIYDATTTKYGVEILMTKAVDKMNSSWAARLEKFNSFVPVVEGFRKTIGAID